MTEWKSLAGKFTSEQLEVIKQFQKKLGLNKNQFVRLSVMMMIFFVGSLFKLVESNVDKEISKEYKKIRKEISKYPELKEKIFPFLEKMAQSYNQTIAQIIKENEPEIKKFTKKRKTGRPKSRKKKRGRPKDTEF